MNEPNPTKKPHLSPSQINMWGFCEQQYHFRYVEGLKIPPGVALIKGRAVHKAAEVNYKQKMESHEDLAEDVLTEAAASEFEQAIKADGLGLSQEEESMGRENVIGTAKDSAIGLTRSFKYHVAPLVQPAIVEQFIRLTIQGASHDLLGRLDVADDQDRVLDLKSGAKHKSQGDADTNVGITFYGIGFKIVTGRYPSEYALDSITEGREPHKRIATVRDEGDTTALISRMNHMLGRLKEGSPPKPAPIGHFLCDPKWCGYHPKNGGPCRFVKG